MAQHEVLLWQLCNKTQGKNERKNTNQMSLGANEPSIRFGSLFCCRFIIEKPKIN